LSVAPQNRRREVGAGHASRSSGLLRIDASRVRISQSGLKTSGCVTTGGARDTIVKVASSQVEDGRVDTTGCVRPLPFSMY
jgi:hypothetical protein